MKEKKLELLIKIIRYKIFLKFVLGLFLLNERVRSQLTIFSGSGDSDLSWQEDPDMLNFIDNMDIFDEEKTCTDGFELIDNECKNLDECALGQFKNINICFIKILTLTLAG